MAKTGLVIKNTKICAKNPINLRYIRIIIIARIKFF